MSRIGKLPVEIPQGVTVGVTGNVVTVEGPKGKLTQDFRQEIDVNIDGAQVILTRKNETKAAKSFHGLYRNLVNNMVIGVSTGFSKVLVINGVGYRAEVQGKVLVLNLGYSNPIEFGIDEDLEITCEGNNRVIVSGIDKQKVGQVSAELRSLRPPEPYKGKGIKYETENIRRKVGKSGIA